MSRKPKIGIDYFSHDVDILQDIKIKLVKAKHGLIGYAVYLRLLEEIYRDCGYYLKITDDFNILFSDDSNIILNDYILILNECIEKGLFEKELFENFNILTSKRVQINYCAATERRKEVSFISNYLLVDVEKLYNLEKVNVIIKALNVDINTQSKVKESKSKVDKETLSLFEKAFEKWWGTFPKRNGKRIGKKEAMKEFLKVKKDDWSLLKISTENYSNYIHGCDQSARDASRFLKGEHWKEYIDPADIKSNGSGNQMPKEIQ